MSDWVDARPLPSRALSGPIGIPGPTAGSPRILPDDCDVAFARRPEQLAVSAGAGLCVTLEPPTPQGASAGVPAVNFGKDADRRGYSDRLSHCRPPGSSSSKTIAAAATTTTNIHCQDEGGQRPNRQTSMLHDSANSSPVTTSLLASPASSTANNRDSPARPSHSKKSDRDETFVKRPLNSFMLYRKDYQHKIPTRNHQSISKIIGDMWRKETAETKIYYDGLAKEERDRHLIENPGYKFQPRKKKNAKSLRTAARRRKMSSDANESYTGEVEASDSASFDVPYPLARSLSYGSTFGVSSRASSYNSYPTIETPDAHSSPSLNAQLRQCNAFNYDDTSSEAPEQDMRSYTTFPPRSMTLPSSNEFEQEAYTTGLNIHNPFTYPSMEALDSSRVPYSSMEDYSSPIILEDHQIPNCPSSVYDHYPAAFVPWRCSSDPNQQMHNASFSSQTALPQDNPQYWPFYPNDIPAYMRQQQQQHQIKQENLMQDPNLQGDLAAYDVEFMQNLELDFVASSGFAPGLSSGAWEIESTANPSNGQ